MNEHGSHFEFKQGRSTRSESSVRPITPPQYKRDELEDTSFDRPTPTVSLPSMEVVGRFLVTRQILRADAWSAAVAKAASPTLHAVLVELSAPAEMPTETPMRRKHGVWLTQFQTDQILCGRAESLLIGPYVLMHRHGRGGMAEVFEAYNRELGRIEAVKVIRADRLSGAKAHLAKLAQREGRLLAALVHPNITAIYRADRNHDSVYLGMEFVRGETLEQYVTRKKSESQIVPVGTAVDFILHAADALSYAHEHNVVHRDVKPGNIMVGSRGEVKVLDVGIAGLLSGDFEELDEDGNETSPSEGSSIVNVEGCGTPIFMAPEQFETARASPEMDVYGLSATLHFLLTGKPPFESRDFESLHREKLQKGPLDLRAIRKDVPTALATVIRTAMSATPAARYHTMQQFMTVLAPFAASNSLKPVKPIPWIGVVCVVLLAFLSRFLPIDRMFQHNSTGLASTFASTETGLENSAAGQQSTKDLRHLKIDAEFDNTLTAALNAEAEKRWDAAARLYMNAASQRHADPRTSAAKIAECWICAADAKLPHEPATAVAFLNLADAATPNQPAVLERLSRAYLADRQPGNAARAIIRRQAIVKDSADNKGPGTDAVARLLQYLKDQSERGDSPSSLALLETPEIIQALGKQTARNAATHARLAWAKKLTDGNTNPEKAVALATTALADAPDNLAAVKILAIGYGRLAKWSDAVDTCIRWSRLDNASAAEALELAVQYFASWAREASDAGDFKNAVARYDAAFAAAPAEAKSLAASAAVAWNQIGYSELKQTNFRNAVAAFNKALDLAPKSALVLRNRGYARFKLAEYLEAVDDYSASILEDASHSSAFELRGTIRLLHLEPKDWDVILSDLSTAARLDDSSAQTHYYLAYVYSSCPVASKRDGERAVRHAEKACKATKFGQWEYLAILAAAHAQAGKFDEAVLRLEQAIQLAPLPDRKTLDPLLSHYRDKKPPP